MPPERARVGRRRSLPTGSAIDREWKDVMVAFGYSLLCEQRGPRELVADAVAAERAGFDFEVISDHYFPWLDSQGHAPNAWAVLGAVASATARVPLMTYVTCPILRYHPAVVAQQAATVALLAGEGRFTLGLGAGENLNEHVVGEGWPPVNVRHVMLAEAIEIIRALFAGGYVTLEGEHYRVDSAKLWDRPEGGVPIAVAVSGSQSIDAFAPLTDAMIAVEPEASLVLGFDAAAGATLPKIGQQPVSWGPDPDEAAARAHDQFRWFAGGWKVNAELPGTSAFAAATQFVRPADVAESIPCGPDVAAQVEAVRPFVEAGYTHLALVQVGGDTQPEFLSFAERELLPALREEYGKADDARIPVHRRS
jgi:G6PDH family F420-dependent oxidoreductase